MPAPRDLIASSAAALKERIDEVNRLNVFPVTIPPLRERPEDIPMLVWMLVRQLEKRAK